MGTLYVTGLQLRADVSMGNWAAVRTFEWFLDILDSYCFWHDVSGRAMTAPTTIKTLWVSLCNTKFSLLSARVLNTNLLTPSLQEPSQQLYKAITEAKPQQQQQQPFRSNFPSQGNWNSFNNQRNPTFRGFNQQPDQQSCGNNQNRGQFNSSNAPHSYNNQ